jgi:hypothetical protein
MTARREPITVAEHRQLGLTLARMRDELVQIGVWLGSERLPKNHAIVRRLETARNRIDDTRSDLENIMYDRHDGQPGVSTEVYYPDQTAR